MKTNIFPELLQYNLQLLFFKCMDVEAIPTVHLPTGLPYELTDWYNIILK